LHEIEFYTHSLTADINKKIDFLRMKQMYQRHVKAKTTLKTKKK